MAPPVKHMFPVGHRSHHLVVTGAPITQGKGYRFWPVRCDCGMERNVRTDWLVDGRVKSCGCMQTSGLAGARTKHGLSGTPEYEAWFAMKARCFSLDDSQYANYGGRGITVCEAWNDSFAAFYLAMGPRPSADHSLDRRDNDGNYEPNNCRWATPTEQARNRRKTLKVSFNGQERVLAELCDQFGRSYHVVYQRIFRYGLSVDVALSRPIKKEITL
jgi:hypothetical protein